MKVFVLGSGRSGQAARAFLEARGDQVEMGDALPENLDADLVVISPGIRSPKCPVEMIGEMELGLRALDRPAVGITGTNGKTTTTELVAHLVEGTACGNNGYPLTQALMEKTGPLAIEMSSYQLETASTPCLDGAVILNITPDHLDRHGTMENYIAAKERIALCLKEGAPLYRDMNVEEAAFKLAECLGKKRGLEGFKRPAHRLEDLGCVAGVRFINDSKATNVEAVCYGLKQMSGPVILLAGGQDKGGDFLKWLAYRDVVKKVVAFGDAAEQIETMLRNHFSVETVKDLKEATKKAFEEAALSDTIMLSPGCASFDAFRDFEMRGEMFKRWMRELEDES